jgi:geranylgeranyl diphosphate synthase type II
MMTKSHSEQLSRYREHVNAAMEEALQERLGPRARDGELAQAMRYAVQAGGKRLRPALVLAGCELLGGDPNQAMYAAVAIEFIHTYSLIHDDLPAMDNGEMRRGLPTVHRRFGEGIAVLAGDALLTEAFAIVALGPTEKKLPVERYLQVCQIFADVAGVRGMVRGQELDLLNEGKPVDLETLQEIHRHKTAAMIRGSVVAGAILGGASQDDCTRLSEFGERIGVAFQIRDDLLDVSGDAAALGKNVGQDIVNEKATYPALLGIDESHRRMEILLNEAHELLLPYGDRAAFLHDLATLIGERRS